MFLLMEPHFKNKKAFYYDLYSTVKLIFPNHGENGDFIQIISSFINWKNGDAE